MDLLCALRVSVLFVYAYVCVYVCVGAEMWISARTCLLKGVNKEGQQKARESVRVGVWQ